MDVAKSPVSFEMNGYSVNIPKGVAYERKENFLHINNEFGVVKLLFKSSCVEVYVIHRDSRRNSFLLNNVEEAVINVFYNCLKIEYPEKELVIANNRKSLMTQKLDIHTNPLTPDHPDYHNKRKYYTVDNPKKTAVNRSKHIDEETPFNLFEEVCLDTESMKTVFDCM